MPCETLVEAPRTTAPQSALSFLCLAGRYTARMFLVLEWDTRHGLVTFVYASNHFEGSAPLTLERLLGILAEKPRPSR